MNTIETSFPIGDLELLAHKNGRATQLLRTRRVIHIDILFILVTIVEGIVLPEFRGTDTEIALNFSLVPENRILQLVGPGVVVDYEALPVFRALVHDLAEELKVGKGRPKILKNTLSI